MKRWLLVLAVVVAASVAWAQPPEFEPRDPPAADKRAPAHKQRSPQARGDAIQGPVYTYADGDRSVRVRLQPDLEVSGDSGVARSGGEHIITKDSTRRSSGLPVFRSESSGALMTLPGGVLLVLDAAWGETQTNTFFARSRIKLSRVSSLEITANSFFVETAPGFPSLELANTLAGQEGVLISSPNWWRDHTTK